MEVALWPAQGYGRVSGRRGIELVALVNERLCCTMLADVEKYLRHVDCFDLSDEQKVELIRAVWQIVEGFADRAFRLDSAPPEVPRYLSFRQSNDAPVGVTNGRVEPQAILDLRSRLDR